MIHENDLFSQMAKRFPVKSLTENSKCAHHPTCEKYDNHIVWIGKNAYCIGCTFFALGVFTMIPLLLILIPYNSQSWSNAGILIGIGFLVFCSFIPQIAFRKYVAKHKRIKMYFRFNLGAGATLMIYGAFVLMPFTLLGIILRPVAYFIYWAIYRLFFKIRAKYQDQDCDDCDKGQYPFCDDNYEQIKKAIKELEENNKTEETLYGLLTSLEYQIREKPTEKLVEIVKI